MRSGLLWKALPLFTFCLLFPRGIYSSGTVLDCQIHSDALSAGGEKPERTLSLYFPEEYESSNKPYPVLYLIHGANGNNMTFLGKGYWGSMSDANVSQIMDKLIKDGSMKPLIVACIDVRRSWFTRWDEKEKCITIAPYEKYLLEDIISFVDSKYRTIRDRSSRAICGHSQGGYDSLLMSLLHPDVFSIAGGLAADTNGSMTEDLDKFMKSEEVKKNPIQIWLYAGTKDEFGTSKKNRELIGLMKDRGLEAEYLEDGSDHVKGVAAALAEYLKYLSVHLKW